MRDGREEEEEVEDERTERDDEDEGEIEILREDRANRWRGDCRHVVLLLLQGATLNGTDSG